MTTAVLTDPRLDPNADFLSDLFWAELPIVAIGTPSCPITRLSRSERQVEADTARSRVAWRQARENVNRTKLTADEHTALMEQNVLPEEWMTRHYTGREARRVKLVRTGEVTLHDGRKMPAKKSCHFFDTPRGTTLIRRGFIIA